ncbi:Leucine-rich repeat protein [Seminavis robusta]|uniref:Leucine-rich repeat protein n=1 Tax=Seminavis robusta TaxID=568900 RepID=A0A9N8HKF8_9STRA|nr:Leucine-rich repeat protein [Seminavis robusta]|eukprot:Sro729_g193820.1 Leucine-rich repeat protein (445) ;mRNA; f:21155-22489
MAALSSTGTTLEITLSVATVDSCLDLIQEAAAHQHVMNAVVTLEGVDNRDGNGAFLGDDQILRCFSAMATHLTPQLEHLRLEWNMVAANFFELPPVLSVHALVFIVQHFTSVKSLSLYRVKLAGNPASYDELTAAVRQNTTLNTIRVEFCAPLGSPNLDAVVNSWSQLTELRELEVIGFQGDPARGCTSTSLRNLGQPPHIRTLKLWGGILQSEDPQAISNLARGLEQTKSITDLEIGLFQLDLPSAQALAKLLNTNTSLDRIWLDVNNSLEPKLIEPLSQAMKQNTTIKSFNLVSTTNHEVSDDVLELFVEMAKTNCTLRHCTIRGCSTFVLGGGGPQGPPVVSPSLAVLRDALKFYLKLNRVGRKQLLANSRSRHRWLSALICEANQTSVIYYLLQRNPSFISQCVRLGPTKRKHVLVATDAASSMDVPQRKRPKRCRLVTP